MTVTPLTMTLRGVLVGLTLLWGWIVTAHAQIHHELTVSLDPSAHRLAVTDRLTLPESTNRLSLLLHAGLSPAVTGAGATLTAVRSIPEHGVPLQQLNIELLPDVRTFTLQYSGEIDHPIASLGAEYARSFNVPPGLIAPEGVYLSGSSYWIPQPANTPLTFTMTVVLPGGWRSMSQGDRVHQESTPADHETWTIDKPQQELYLIAGQFEAYHDAAGAVQAEVLLRQPDTALAGKYLEATRQYIALYRRLIGPYPYGKFALVENFWETGYGMPSFTLLGPRVIRFPFILHSSYPHEILHNWWGNGVYVDYGRGNWCEGLTSYLADHLIQEQRSQGIAYRRQALQKYTDYVRDQKDFPLTAFHSRHSAVTEAVGYGKTLMLFHMLRQQLGDETFVAALQTLYRRYAFKVADFDEVMQVFADVAGQPLRHFVEQWVKRTGAPSLRVREATATPVADGFQLSAVIEQTQAGETYELTVPLAVHLEGTEHAYQSRMVLRGRQEQLDLKLPTRPVLLEVDPEFDVFRRLHRREIPPALSQAFGASAALIVLPAAAPAALQAAYRQLAAIWSQGGQSDIEVKVDRDLTTIPGDRAVWLLGWENRFRPEMHRALSDYQVPLAADAVTLDGQTLARRQHAVVLVARHPENPDAALAWVAADNVAALPGLGRKLPHYGKYSYLAFHGDEPENVVKGQWPVLGSPMAVAITQSDGRVVRLHRAALAPRSALAAR